MKVKQKVPSPLLRLLVRGKSEARSAVPVASPLLHDIIRFDVRWRFGNMCFGGEFSAGMVCGGLD